MNQKYLRQSKIPDFFAAKQSKILIVHNCLDMAVNSLM